MGNGVRGVTYVMIDGINWVCEECDRHTEAMCDTKLVIIVLKLRK
jgi:hypothetical protein